MNKQYRRKDQPPATKVARASGSAKRPRAAAKRKLPPPFHTVTDISQINLEDLKAMTLAERVALGWVDEPGEADYLLVSDEEYFAALAEGESGTRARRRKPKQ